MRRGPSAAVIRCGDAGGLEKTPDMEGGGWHSLPNSGSSSQVLGYLGT